MKTYIHPNRPENNRDVTALYNTAWWRGLREWRTYRHVETFCVFLGYPRSGHSLVGALLDAHPNMVIAHEAEALGHLAAGFHRRQLYALLMMRAANFAAAGCQWQGYNYAVPNQWQGRVQTLKVIGDKKGGLTTQWLAERPALLAQLRAEVRVPVKLIHIVRNPFDNIATIFKRKQRDSLEAAAEWYFSLCTTAGQVIKENAADILTVRHENLIADTPAVLRSIVRFLGLDCTDQYLRDCASIVFSSPRQSRHSVEWSESLRAAVQDNIAKHDFLQGYSFVSPQSPAAPAQAATSAPPLA